MSRIRPARKEPAPCTPAQEGLTPTATRIRSSTISNGKATEVIRHRLQIEPRLAIVLGTGFGGVATMLDSAVTLPYREVPGWAVPTVAGHAGCLLGGHLEGVPLLLLNGRAHYYEGYSFAEVTFAMRVLAALGVTAVVLTNAAGAINAQFRRGQFMALTDHINFLGDNPLRGQAHHGADPFVDLTEVYDSQLRRLLQQAARNVRVPLRNGVYLAVPGPSYETPAEIRAFRHLGADAVGMGTVAEAIVARAGGLRVAGLSALTNAAAGVKTIPLSHADVLRQGTGMGPTAAKLLREFVRLYGKTG